MKMNGAPQETRKYTAEHRRKRKWLTAVTCLAAVVVFCTTYALILPAITLEKEQSLACSYAVHKHEDSCYNGDGELVCGYADYVVHSHQEDYCYDADGNLICSLPEVEPHEHTSSCYQEKKVLICEEPESDGHVHSEDCYEQVRGELTCENEDPEHEHDDSCYEWTEQLTCGIEEGDGAHQHTEDCYQTKTELTCEKDEVIPHTHSADCYDGDGKLTCGKLQVEEHQHDGNCVKATEEEPHADASTEEEMPEEPAASAEVELCMDSVFENDSISAAFHIEGTATLPETNDAEATPEEESTSAAQETGAEDSIEGTEAVSEEAVSEEAVPEEAEPVVMVSELDSDNTDYQRIAGAAQNDDLLDLSVVQLEVYYDDQKLDLSGCTVTAQVTPTEQLMESLQEVCLPAEEDRAPEAEVGILFAALESDGITEQASALVLPDTSDTPVLTTSIGSDGIMTVAASQTANPQFKVQYYAYLDTVVAAGKEKIDSIIDTSGKKLPKNGSTPTTKSIGLTSVGGGKYKVATKRTLTQVYSEHEYEYITAPNLSYFNRLYKNGNYKLQKIWILKSGKDSSSTNEADWEVYDPAVTHFTNREASAKENTVLITDDTVIRLVFDTTDSTYTNAANFYDYDITDDRVHTAARGINSASNYTGRGAKLAFGNANTDTGLAGEIWNGNTLNKSNANGYMGCTFGLVTGLSNGNIGLSDDKIQYASGVTAPNLFNDGGANGKTSYDSSGYSLSFNRTGDTYILSAVNGTNVTGLEQFNHPTCGSTTHTHIWTNNFWPMDGVTNTDPHTGKYGDTGHFVGATKSDTYPPSDDGLPHNSMFGMQYAVQFTLTEDYAGPLEYYFFGDDDMWVFLDGQLVCDIGGVHRSVGEYVNLWDYVGKGTAGTHTLSFYYIERGLSGSTCYMQFTLPSVSSVTPEQNTGLLTVEKKVEGTSSSDEEFQFEITFTDENGNPLPDDYSYTRYAADGTVVKQDVIIYDGGSFELKADERVIINYLPYGTKYTITETDLPQYTVTYTVNGGGSQERNTAGGQIETGKNGTVVFTNTAKPMLPNTGGAGTTLFTIGGLFLITGAVGCGYGLRRRRERREAE